MKRYFKLIFLLCTLLFIKTNEAQNELIFNTKSNIIFKDSIPLNDSIVFNEKKINQNIKFSLRDSLLYIPIVETEPKFLNQKNYKKIDSEILTSGSFARGFANGLRYVKFSLSRFLLRIDIIIPEPISRI